MVPGGDQVGQLGPVQAGELEETVVVGHPVDGAVVGDPVGADGVEGGRGHAGQPEVEIVTGLQEGGRVPVDLGKGVPDEQDVRDRVLARQPGGSPGDLHPADDLPGVVSHDVDRTPGHLADGLVAAGVHPDDRPHEGPAVRPHGHGARPLGGAAHPDEGLRRHPGLGHGPIRRGGDGRPPLGGILFGTAPVEQVEGHRFGGVGHDGARSGDHRHLGSTGAEVDGQHVLLGGGRPGGRAPGRATHRAFIP